MKKSILGMFALATMVVAMSAFKSADATAVKSADSTTTMVDSLVRVDSLAGVDSIRSFKIDSLAGLDSIRTFKTDSLAGLDSLKGIDAIRTIEGGSITGKVTPANGATEVEAINGAEKLKGAVSQGAFTIPAAKAGTYTITILGKSPYKNAIIKDVKVEEGKATDLGEIKLEQ
ncbi:hypothetical protein CLV51_11210 [Chitinophaga niastensis]|uniref:Carboxypeptidase family protein n=1 Tax=Chitinophaga niastensis TaxID=536980 RepID=A0A2P8H8E2_CHINA|nr:carboxypeptidase-like regulatory domain-containing protein [Chitinophaga niastensis]PSL42482.1 hypothetical protein CLV51_11210 [Chitinophaga niastensis]